jgi:hypothetical protein
MNEQNQSDEISLKINHVKLKVWLSYIKMENYFFSRFNRWTIGIGLFFASKPTYTASLSFALEDENLEAG